MIDKIPPFQRKVILVLADSVVTIGSLLTSFTLLFSFHVAVGYLQQFYPVFFLFLITRLLTFQRYGLYAFSWRYASTKEFIRIISSVTISSIIIMAFFYLLRLTHFPIRVIVIDWAFNMLFVGSIRAGLRIYRDFLIRKSNTAEGKNILIIGAGDAGEMMAREISRVSTLKYNLKGFIDDKKNKVGRMIHQVPVLGTTKDLATLVQKHRIEEVVIAIPSAKGKRIREIMELCETAQVPFKITPGLADIVGGRVSISQLRSVRLEDLLRREVVQMDVEGVSEYLSGSTVLVTGAGGSIGSELCRQILRFSPKQILLLDHDENAVYQIHMELKNNPQFSTALIPIVLDVRNRDRLDQLFGLYQPQVVFHAAAHKHVPLMEENVREVIENNVLGIQHLLELSDQHEVREFVLISTDKAVRPTSCMGATKRLCEILVQAQATKSSKTKFSSVRFGNVLGSQGSVVPLFKDQIASGGPVTVTHEEMTRFFMTIPEAVSLVIETGALSKGGEIFILDMGEPVKIIDLARDLIHLSGLEEGKDIDIQIIGLRPAEKLHEELFFDKASLTQTPHKQIFVTEPAPFNKSVMTKKINALFDLCKQEDDDAIREALLALCR